MQCNPPTDLPQFPFAGRRWQGRAASALLGTLVVGSSAALGSAGLPPSAEGPAAIIELPPLAGDPQSEAYGLNGSGQVVGVSGVNPDGLRAVLWQNGQPTPLETLGGRFSRARAINEAGHIVGAADTDQADAENRPISHAVLWRNGEALDLGTLGGATSTAHDVNSHDQVVGVADLPFDEFEEPRRHAFLWQNGRMRDLGTLGGAVSVAYGINDRGQIVGESETREGSTHAFLWDNGRMRDLGSLGGGVSTAYDVNELSQIAGTSAAGGLTFHAFLWENGRMTDLGSLGGSASLAVDIDESGQLAGFATTRNSRGYHACLWQDGGILDLNQQLPHGSGWELAMANAMNGKKQIVGTGIRKDGIRAFLLTRSGEGGGNDAPDLTPSWQLLRQTFKGRGARRRATVSGRVHVRNVGKLRAAAATLSILLSADDVPDGRDSRLKEVPVERLAPGASRIVNFRKRLPRGRSATGKYVIAVVSTTGDSDTSNNADRRGPIP